MVSPTDNSHDQKPTSTFLVCRIFVDPILLSRRLRLVALGMSISRTLF
jgi:hypothetical protein